MELVTGAPATSMKLQVFGKDDKLVCDLDNNDALLGSYPVDDDMRIHVSSDRLTIGVRANIHLGVWGGRPSFARMDSVGGGGSSRNFPGYIFCGVPGFFPLTPVTDPKFVLFFR